MKYINVKLLISLLFTATILPAQNLSFRSYTSAQGLSQNSGYCIAQDGLGQIWMGTQDGLNKFNGRQIITYYKENTVRGTLPNSFIKSLYYDSVQNWLWIGTGSGLCIYNARADSFYTAAHYFNSPVLDSIMIRSVIGISDYETIVISFYDGLFICNSKLKTIKKYFQQAETKSNTTAATQWQGRIIAACNGQLYEVKDKPLPLLPEANLGDVRNLTVWKNELWVSSSAYGIFKIKNTAVLNAASFGCGSKEIGPLVVDNENNLWIGSRNKGIIILSPEEKIIHTYESAANQDEWPQKFSLSFLKDREGSIWTGSSGGGFTVSNKYNNQFSLIRKREPLAGKAAHNMILCMYAFNNSSIFLGTQLEGMRLYNRQSGQTASFLNKGLPGSNSIYSITASSATDMWLATAAGLHHFDAGIKKFTSYADAKYPASQYGQSVYKLKYKDSLIYSSNEGTVFFDLATKQFKPFTAFDKAPALKKLIVYKYAEDVKGNTWMGCLDKGLVQYNAAENKVTAIKKIQNFSNTVYAIYAEKNILWLGTTGGLIIYNTDLDSIIKVFTIANGLPGNVIYSIEEDMQGNMWCSSNVGLIKVNTLNFSIVHITVSSGLQSGEFNTACSIKDSSGNLFFGGINGVSFFNPAAFSFLQYSSLPLITSLKIFNKEAGLPVNLAYAKEILLSHDQNFITLEFAVPNYNNEASIYRYQLTGADKDWVIAGSRNYANYTNLSPGKYVFNLQSANSNGTWNKAITRLEIIITPAWWQTWWIRLAAIVLLAAMIIALVRKRFNTVKQNSVIQQKITETEMAALKAQMNPHFMFNCINSIDAFIHSNDKYNATLYLNKFAKLLRNILDSSKQNTVLLSKDIETLKLYIELEELRHENKFTTTLTVDEELLSSDYKVPPLIIQPFVENAILHGIKNKYADDGLLSVDVKKVGEKIQYSINDNGIGRIAAAKIMQNKESHYGMQMSYDRIKLFNKEAVASVLVTDLYNNEKPAGTQVIVKLNIN
jgi:ligand-binding sensor domain-containing protein